MPGLRRPRREDEGPRPRVGPPVPNQGGVAVRQKRPAGAPKTKGGGRPVGPPTLATAQRRDLPRNDQPVQPNRQAKDRREKPVSPRGESAEPDSERKVGPPQPPSQRVQEPAVTSDAVPEDGAKVNTGAVAQGPDSENVGPPQVPEVDEQGRLIDEETQPADAGAGAQGQEGPPEPPGQKPQLDAQGRPVDPESGVGVQPGGIPQQQVPGALQKQEYNLTRSISTSELSTAPAGIFNTPNGSFEKAEDGTVTIRGLSERGKQRLESLKKVGMKDFGDFPGSDDPNAPKPPIVPGMPAFNPYTGDWSGIPMDGSILEKFGNR